VNNLRQPALQVRAQIDEWLKRELKDVIPLAYLDEPAQHEAEIREILLSEGIELELESRWEDGMAKCRVGLVRTEGERVSPEIIRRIDDLGRIAIPKELRRAMNVEEGDALALSIDSQTGTLRAKKYCKLRELKCDVQGVVDALMEISSCEVVLTNNREVIASAGENVPEAGTPAIITDIMAGSSPVFRQRIVDSEGSEVGALFVGCNPSKGISLTVSNALCRLAARFVEKLID